MAMINAWLGQEREIFFFQIHWPFHTIAKYFIIHFEDNLSRKGIKNVHKCAWKVLLPFPQVGLDSKLQRHTVNLANTHTERHFTTLILSLICLLTWLCCAINLKDRFMRVCVCVSTAMLVSLSATQNQNVLVLAFNFLFY